jgi:Xaa-Pro aminopeptidase
MDYGHGTGHGVGAALNVHEGPHSISPRPTNATPLKPGMIVSNEPGFYKPGDFGIRIENLLIVKESDKEREGGGGKWLKFEKLTLIPIQKSLIDKTLMSEKELDWIDAYHEEVWEKVSAKLPKGAQAWRWLKIATEPIER